MKDLVTDPDAWSAIAESYDEGARRILTPFSIEAVGWAELDDTDDVLDVACGPGTTTLLAAREARRVRGVDFSPGMIARLRENTEEMFHVSSTVGDGQKLELEDDSFSAAFSMFGLMFFADPLAGLRELHRVLRKGGRVFISSWVPREDSPMMRPIGEAMRHAMPPAPDQAPPDGFAFETSESLAAGLREGGFADVEVREVTPDIPIDGADGYWALMGQTVIANHIRTESGSEWPAIEARVLEHLRGALDGVTSLAMPALIARGWKR